MDNLEEITTELFLDSRVEQMQLSAPTTNCMCRDYNIKIQEHLWKLNYNTNQYSKLRLTMSEKLDSSKQWKNIYLRLMLANVYANHRAASLVNVINCTQSVCPSSSPGQALKDHMSTKRNNYWNFWQIT